MITVWQIFYGLDRMKYLVTIIYYLKIDKVLMVLLGAIAQAKAKRYGKLSQQKIKFVPQGGHDFEIIGNIKNFKIHETSHLKSGTYLECSGGIQIGSYFHCGRGLTIFSTNHNWRSEKYLPYDSESIIKPVLIGDGVWVGANVTILPGVTIADAAVIAAGSVIVHDVEFGCVVGGNPAKVIARRNTISTNKLLEEKCFF
jgi:acetyltransferase-like isoleucine patch superfamily enzyme